jgi:hypothetical protein
MNKISIILLVLIYTSFISCQTNCDVKHGTSVYCFIDVTDTINFHLAQSFFSESGNKTPAIYNELQKLYEFDNCCYGEFRLYKINDVGENKFEQIRYPAKDALPADATEFQIKDDPSVKKFKTSFAAVFEKMIQEESLKLRQTKIYLPVCKALNDLNNSGSERKILILFTDMLENSSIFSFYKEKSPDPIVIMEKLEEVYGEAFPSLKDIEVYIVNKRVPGNDEAIDRASKFWKDVFTDINKAKSYQSGSNLSIE